MLKLIKETAEIYSNKNNKWDCAIRIKRQFIDAFGKDYIEYKIWDIFSTKEIAKKELNRPETIQSMKNCGYNITN